MSLRRFGEWWLCLLLLAACGRSSPRGQVVTSTPAASVVASEPVSGGPAPIISAPSAEAARYFVEVESSWADVRVDAASLSRSALLAELLPFALGQVSQLTPAERACIERALQHSRDLLVSTAHDSGLAILLLDSSGPGALREACSALLAGAARTQIAGSDEAYTIANDMLTFAPGGVLLYGNKSQVEAALNPDVPRAPLPAHFTLSSGDQLAIRFELAGMDATFYATASTSNERFLSVFSAELPSEAEAEVQARHYQETLAQAKSMRGTPGMDPRRFEVLDGFSFKRVGKRLEARIEVKGAPASQARDLKTIFALSKASSRNDERERFAEAQSTLMLIADHVRSAVAAAPARMPRLRSFPAVPAKIPGSKPFASSPQDWKAWASLDFELTEPQFMQYELIAAKDGKSAEIVARGDLHADGKVSELRMKLTLDPKTGRVEAGEIRSVGAQASPD